MSAALQFDATEHRYTLAGKPLPSVTQILAIANDFDRVPQAILENARDRGERLHQAINLYNRDELDYDSLDDETRAGVHAWDRFINESGAAVIASEQPIYHSKLGYAGTPDTVLYWNNRTVIPDIKASFTVPRTVGPQTRAYAEAYRDQYGLLPARYCIHIKDGKYTAHRRDDPADWSVFLSALNLFHFMERA